MGFQYPLNKIMQAIHVHFYGKPPVLDIHLETFFQVKVRKASTDYMVVTGVILPYVKGNLFVMNNITYKVTEVIDTFVVNNERSDFQRLVNLKKA